MAMPLLTDAQSQMVQSALAAVGASSADVLAPYQPMLVAYFPLIRDTIVALALFAIISSLLSYMHSRLLAKATNKKQISNVKHFTRVIRYVFGLLLAVIVASSQITSVQNLSLAFGVITAALAVALQRPVTGIAAWVMIMVRRPFEIGDRVIIGDVRGNVLDVTLSHVYLDEVGRYGGEEISGRTVLVPNSTLFEKNITNYSLTSDYVLGQVLFGIPYESNLDHAIELGLAIVRKNAGEWEEGSGRAIHYRLAFDTSSINIKLRYGVPFTKAQRVASDITKELFDAVRKSGDVEFAYPHTRVSFDQGADAPQALRQRPRAKTKAKTEPAPEPAPEHSPVS